MALLSKAIEEKMFDVRMLERSMHKGIINLQDIEKNEKKLPDDSENAEYTNIDELALESTGSGNLRPQH
ncbi:MAG: hypothetical protein AB7F43_05410 [Bacteriovoracia bacterium]